ncbi:uncharacterized protein AC631_04100 [Debaryomyces fabryi]|uniref:Uncharacterized protein n=1 Tax=Debaryomyces fabryi TaxID=58627 RepID=A0A0V1PV56_9ASCO|nr:uncharacterized protein AC631_04100 [Debaryomyces fabryi]KSA00141.1 hypothetical protein AC631_04100 [Debaryomyces fabryi]CUM47816.1 unnamed protein product [Debaryomyces fabryi]
MLTCSQFSFISSSLSILSLSCWVWAQLPQIYCNYRNKSAEGISPLFLLLWFMGDFLSFTSCLLNDVVLKFQVYLSLFFLCNDIMLCYQYYYYNSVYPRKYGNIENLNTDDADKGEGPMFKEEGMKSFADDQVRANNTSVHTTANAIHIRSLNSNFNNKAPSHTLVQSISSSSSNNNSYSSINDNQQYLKSIAIGSIINASVTAAMPVSMEKLAKDTLISSAINKEALGIFLAWSCTCVYVASRCPQLYKNYKRKSVDGISPILFGCALMGNLTYTLSILTSCEFIYDDAKSSFFVKQLPYILGSSGTVVFDFLYFYQRFLYKDTGRNTTVMSMDDWDHINHSDNNHENSVLL